MSTSIFGSPIAFHPALAEYLGSIEAALFLAQAIYWRGKGTAHETQFYKSQDEWEEETTLNAHAQRKAREILSEYDWWHEERRGIPCRLWYDVDERELRRQFFAWQDAQESGSDGNLTSNPKRGELDMDKMDNRTSTSSTSNTESTTETTLSNNQTRTREDQPPDPHDDDPPQSLDAYIMHIAAKLDYNVSPGMAASVALRVASSGLGDDDERRYILDSMASRAANDTPPGKWAHYCGLKADVEQWKGDGGNDDFFGLFD